MKTEQLTVTVTLNHPRSLNTVVPEEDLEITVDTLRTLAENPGLIKSKACKDLRTAVFEFRKACTTGFNAAGSSRPHAQLSFSVNTGHECVREFLNNE